MVMNGTRHVTPAILAARWRYDIRRYVDGCRYARWRDIAAAA